MTHTYASPLVTVMTIIAVSSPAWGTVTLANDRLDIWIRPENPCCGGKVDRRTPLQVHLLPSGKPGRACPEGA